MCCIYESEAEQRALLTPFLYEGLARREKIIYIVDAQTADMVRASLVEANAPIDAAIASGQFVFLTHTETYLYDGVFDPARMITTLEDETMRACAAGYTALRVTGEMTWALRGAQGSERLIEYETRLNQFFPQHACLALCQYDRRRFGAGILLDVLRTHPIAALGAEIFDNPYYLPPEEMLGADVAGATLARWLDTIKALAQTHAELEHRVAARTRELDASNAQLQTEIAERQHAEQATRASEANARALLNAILESALLLEADGTIVDINEIGAQRLGKPRPELIGTNVYAYLPLEIATARHAKVAWGLQTNEPVIFEDTRNGRTMRHSLYAVPATGSAQRRIAIFAQDITEQKRAEETLAQTNLALHLAQEFSNAGTWDWDMRQDTFYWSAEFRKIFGMDANTVAGFESWQNAVHPADRDLAGQRIQEAIRAKTKLFNEYRIILPDQTIRWIHGIGNTEYAGDTPIRMTGLCIDVTEQKQAEAQLRASEEKYRSLYRDAALGIFHSTFDGKFLDVNPALARMMGYASPEEVLASVHDAAEQTYVVPTQRDQNIQRARESDSIVHSEVRYRRKDGSLWDGLLHLRIVKDAQGQPSHLEGFIEDISERKRAEQKLEIALTKYKTLFEAFPLGISITDDHGNIIEANAESERLLGVPTAEHTERQIDSAEWHIIRPDGSPMPTNEFASVRALAENHRIENVMMGVVKPDHAITWINVTAAPIPPPQHGVAITYNDVTERKLEEDRLETLLTISRMTEQSAQTISDYALEQALRITQSQLGYIYYYSETTRQFTLYAWTQSRMREFTHPEPQAMWASDQTDVWSEAVRQRRAIVVNDFNKECPPDHIAIKRFLSLPIFDGEQVVAVIGVGNKTQPYSAKDEKELTLLMQGVWNILRNQQATQRLRDSEERYRTLIETANEGIWTIDANTITTFANTKMADMLGYTPDEMLGKPLYEFMDAEGKAIAEAYFERRRQGIAEQHDFKFQRKNGAPLWALLSTNPLFRNGQFIGALATIADITQRREAEQALRESEAKFRAIFSQSPIGIELYDAQGRLTDANPACLEIFGINDVAYIKNFELFQDPNLPAAAKQELCAGRPAQYELDFDFDLVRRNNLYPTTRTGICYLDCLINPLADGNNGYLVSVRDMSERKRNENALRAANAELDRWTHELEQRHHQVTLLNEMVELLQTCRTSEEVYRILPRFANAFFHDEIGALFIYDLQNNLLHAATMWGALAPAEQVLAPHDCWALRRNRINLDRQSGLACAHVHSTDVTTLCVPMVAQNEVIGMLHLRAPSTREWSAAKLNLASTVADYLSLMLSNLRLQDILREQATHDPLTNLFNRRYLEETLAREILRATRARTPLALLLCDLDHLKTINDTYGHAAGDRALRELGNFLRTQVRGGDMACRFGGDEFMLILNDTDAPTAYQRAEQMHTQIQHLTFDYLSQDLGVIGVSIGVAAFPQHGADVAALMRAVDAALYRAKALGRNRVVMAE